ncbi:MAG: regulator [Gemmataceae bacterium]
MRVLVAWDNPAEAELLSLYLNVGDDEAQITHSADDALRLAQKNTWDAVLMALGNGQEEEVYRVFQRIREQLPDCPVVGVCDAGSVFNIARYLTNGMRSYLLRDRQGDFIFLVRSTLESVIDAVRAEREKALADRLRQEIEAVRKLQESIIPRNIQCPPGYRICARYEPSQIHVVGGKPVILAGGDYYDVFTLTDDNLVILVGDASGHGMKACMSIMTMHTLVRMIRGQRYQDTASFVEEINRRLCEQSIIHGEGGFITLFYAVLKPNEHQLQWTSAGHPLPIAYDRQRECLQPIGADAQTGLPLGIYPDVRYETHTLPLAPHMRLVLYTDGLVEAFEANTSTSYGLEGLLRTVRRTRDLDLEQALQALFDDSFASTGGQGRHDDTSVVLLERAMP